MSAEDRIRKFESDTKGEGPCPVCHQPRTAHKCWTRWIVALEKGKWEGRITLWCNAFKDDREALCEALNRYHVRTPETP